MTELARIVNKASADYHERICAGLPVNEYGDFLADAILAAGYHKPAALRERALTADRDAAASTNVETDYEAFGRFCAEERDGLSDDYERNAFFAGADHGRSQLVALLAIPASSGVEEQSDGGLGHKR